MRAFIIFAALCCVLAATPVRSLDFIDELDLDSLGPEDVQQIPTTDHEEGPGGAAPVDLVENESLGAPFAGEGGEEDEAVPVSEDADVAPGPAGEDDVPEVAEDDIDETINEEPEMSLIEQLDEAPLDSSVEELDEDEDESNEEEVDVEVGVEGGKKKCRTASEATTAMSSLLKSMSKNVDRKYSLAKKDLEETSKELTKKETLLKFFLNEKGELKNVNSKEEDMIKNIRKMLKKLGSKHKEETKQMNDLLDKCIANLRKEHGAGAKAADAERARRLANAVRKLKRRKYRCHHNTKMYFKRMSEVAKLTRIVIENEELHCENKNLRAQCVKPKVKGTHNQGDVKLKNEHEWAAIRKANKKRFSTKYNHYDFYKVPVIGTANSDSLIATCQKYDLMVPCDHPAYADGRCVVIVKRALHFSYNPHHNFPRNLIANTVWYAANANGGRTLQNYQNTHRWVTNPSGMSTFCVLPSKYTKVKVTYNHFRFYKVRVYGSVNSENMENTCKHHGLFTPCDHPAYSDGRCVVVTKRQLHFSYNPHHNFPRSAIDRTYWYAANANGGKALQNWRNTHRWSGVGDFDGLMFCVAPMVPNDPTKVQATWHGYKWHKVRVEGVIGSENIERACAKHKFMVPCDHPAYADGRCVVIMKRKLHLSYNGHHNFPRSLIDRAYFYAANANGGKALQNWRNTHRWSSGGDMFCDTFCVTRVPLNPREWKLPQESKHGWTFFKTAVVGEVNSESIEKACEKLSMMVPCDHPAYANGRCATLVKRALHFSYNPHHNLRRGVVDRTYWYAANANGGKALQNWRNTHRWSGKGDIDGRTMCVEPKCVGTGKGKDGNTCVNPKHKLGKQYGYDWFKVRVNDIMTGGNILEACKKAGYKTPCDHPAYSDGLCVVVQSAKKHFSYNPHGLLNSVSRSSKDRTYWYAANANGGKTLQNWRNTHRWSATGDMYEFTLCIKN